MNDVKKQILNIAKALQYAASAFKAIVITLIVVTSLQIAAAFSTKIPAFSGFFDGRLSDLEGILGESPIFGILYETANLKAMDPVFQKAIELFITLLSLIVLLKYIDFFRRLISDIIKEQQPFSIPTARRMRRGSWSILLLALINPVLGILMVMLVRFFSLIFEYGAYLQDKADKTSRIQEEVIVSLAEITENKSEQTGQHIRRVSEYSRILAAQMGLDEEAIESIRLASTMHDLGKLMIPSEILDKPGRLTEQEFAEIKKHPAFGEHLLHGVEGDTMTLARQIALQHHERYDGKGYPNGHRQQ